MQKIYTTLFWSVTKMNGLRPNTQKRLKQFHWKIIYYKKIATAGQEMLITSHLKQIGKQIVEIS